MPRGLGGRLGMLSLAADFLTSTLDLSTLVSGRAINLYTKADAPIPERVIASSPYRVPK